MNKTYNKIAEINEENVSGDNLQVHVIKFDNGLEIDIKTQWKSKLKARSIPLILIPVTYLFINDVLYRSILLIVCSFLIINILWIVRGERLVVVKSLGYQLESKYLFHNTSNFIPWDSIENIFINEIFSVHRVLFTLNIYTKHHGKKLIPLFTATKPRLNILKYTYGLLKAL